VAEGGAQVPSLSTSATCERADQHADEGRPAARLPRGNGAHLKRGRHGLDQRQVRLQGEHQSLRVLQLPGARLFQGLQVTL